VRPVSSSSSAFIRSLVRRQGWLAQLARDGALLCALGLTASLAAETFDYGHDQPLMQTQVTLPESENALTLRQFIAACEQQTDFSFAYRTDNLPLDAALSLPQSESPLSLAQAFWAISSRKSIVFERVNRQIAVRFFAEGDTLRPLRDDAPRNAQEGRRSQPDLETFELEAFAVEGEYNEKMETLELRMQDVKFQNMLSADDMSRYAAGDMSEAIGRIAGVNVAEGRFAVIRGLSERYSATLVNGIPVPSADPEKQGVHLDLFSTDIVSRLEVSKTFSPDGPGNAAGGFINIVTTRIPNEPFADISFGTKFNDRAQRDYVTYTNAGRSDSWAMGTNDRITQVFGYDGTGVYRYAHVSDYSPERPWAQDGANYTLPEGVDLVGQHESPPLGLGFTASAGGGFGLFDRQFRILTTVAYDSSYKTEDGSYQKRWTSSYTFLNPFLTVPSIAYGLLPSHDPQFNYIHSQAEIDITALAALQFDLDPRGNHQITLTGFHSRVGEDTVFKFEDGRFEYEPTPSYFEGAYSLEGPQRPVGSGLLKSRLANVEGAIDDLYYRDIIYYEERTLSSLQLLGRHYFNNVGATPLKAEWALSHNTTSTEEPDARYLEYYYVPSEGVFGSDTSRDEGSSNYRSWRFIDEEQDFARTDLEYEFIFNTISTLDLSGGASYDESTRDVLQGRSLFVVSGRDEDAEELFSANGSATAFIPKTSNRDVTANSLREMKAAYVSGVFTLFDKVDLIAGARAESLEMTSQAIYIDRKLASITSLFTHESLGIGPVFDLGPGDDGTYWAGTLDRVFLLPSLGAAYRPIEGLSVRLNYGETVARPSFREYTAYMAFTPDSLEQNLGNPQLETSDVRSTDFRTEYVWGAQGDLAAMSLFYKEVDRPIEKVQMDSTNYGEYYVWVNNDHTAYLNGLELEFRKHLGFLGDFWSDFSIGGNYTYIDAVVKEVSPIYEREVGNWDPYFVDIPEDALFTGSSQERRLFDQPEWIVNTDLTYEHEESGTRLTIAYYAISEILDASAAASPTMDLYLNDYYRVDFTARQRLLDGLQLSLSIKNLTDSLRSLQYDPYATSKDIYQRRYRVGRDYSISLSYSF